MEKIDIEHKNLEEMQIKIIDEQLANIILVPKATLEQFNTMKS